MISTFSTLIFIFGLGCEPSPSPPKLPEGPVERLFSADLNGDGTDSLFHLNDGTLSWSTGSVSVEGSVQAWDAGPRLAGPDETLILGFGRSRQHPKAAPTLVLVNEDGAEVIPIGKAVGLRVVDVSFDAAGVLVTILGAEKKARGFRLDGSNFVPVTDSIMGLQQVALDRTGHFAIGTLYGPTPRSHGGLIVQGPQGTKKSLTTIRGVRTMILADVDGDGIQDLVVADGWHFRYGHDAQALLSYYPGPTYGERVDIAELLGSYTINDIAHVPRQDGGYLIVSASSQIAKIQNSTLGWTVTKIADASDQTKVSIWSSTGGFFSSKQHHWLLISDKNPQILRLP